MLNDFLNLISKSNLKKQKIKFIIINNIYLAVNCIYNNLNIKNYL